MSQFISDLLLIIFSFFTVSPAVYLFSSGAPAAHRPPPGRLEEPAERPYLLRASAVRPTRSWGSSRQWAREADRTPCVPLGDPVRTRSVWQNRTVSLSASSLRLCQLPTVQISRWISNEMSQHQHRPQRTAVLGVQPISSPECLNDTVLSQSAADRWNRW